MIECVAWLASIEPIPKAPSFFKERGGLPVHNKPDLWVQHALSMVDLDNPANQRDFPPAFCMTAQYDGVR